MRVFLLALAMQFAGAAWAQAEAQQQQQRQAEQPGNNAPVWRDVKAGEKNFTTIKGRETDVLVQPPARFPGQNVTATAGEAWRKFRNGPVTFYGGWLVVLVALAVLAFYFWKGPVKLQDRPSGRLVRRFSTLEQVVHWSAAISFCVLGISGLIMLFGKYLLLPVIGYTLFAWLTALGKNLHNFIAPGEHIPSGRFNAGEKAWFWGGVIVLSVIVSWSGIILLFPNFDQTRAVMQDAWIWHASAALLYIAISFGHIYMGTIGVEGAYGNMRTGYTDETWAKEHHGLWYNEVKSGSRAPAGGAVPAGASYAKLPAAPAKTDAEKAAEADKAAATKAKEAAELGKAQDKAVANYKKHKGVSMDTRKK